MTGTQSKVRFLCDAGTAVLRKASKAGIVTALVALGLTGLPGQVQAQESSYVAGTATPQPSGRYLYEFTVVAHDWRTREVKFYATFISGA